ncbi:Serine acetyltransferase [hydrothermal vent metagenome]|uniref:Serine acetyltransferase n=1 Tax=hydrothermal vent metagenome TaxID=652676 RepID=A0A1W1CD08_9ZZZZ
MVDFHNKFKPIRKFFQRRLYYKYHCDISHTATIHPSVTFPHPIAIVIGSQATIHKNCSIYQNVTIGSNFDSDNSMPTIEANTLIGTGAKLIGNITVGKNCIIGANAVVTKSVPNNSIVTGVNNIRKRDNI